MSNARRVARLIVGTEVKVTGVDSDLSNNLTNINSRLDSDDAAIQAANTLAVASTGEGLTDSDLKVVADLRSQLDSEILSVRNLSLSYTNYFYTATAGQTAFTGSDDNSATLAYTAGAIQVFLNGVILDPNTDYTATDGTTVTLTEAAAAGHQLSILTATVKSTYVPTVVVNWAGLTQQTKLQSSTFNSNDGFGRFIDFAGDYFLVSATAEDISPYENNGAAFVFKRTDSDGGTGWEQQAILTLTSSAHSNSFGNSVQLSDDARFALVSAKTSAATITQFTRSGSTWTEGQTISDPGTTGTDVKFARFGNLEISGGTGNYFVVGSANDDDGGANKGSAWVYYRDSDGAQWSLQQEISDSERGDESEYGASLSFPNDSTIVVGARKYSAGSESGAVFIWERTGTTWERTHKILNTSVPYATEYFGYDVSMNAEGTYLAISRSRITLNSNNNQGDVHIYYKSGGTWSLQDTITASDGGDGHYFGSNLDLRGDDTLLVAAYGNQKAYLFTRSDTSWTQQKAFTGDDSPTVFGGDHPSGTKINKDTSKNDLAVGANNRGAYVFAV